MAVVTGLNQEDKDKQQTAGQPAVINAGSQPPPGVTPGAAPGKPVSSGRFTNIQSFLNANKGAGQKLGGALTGSINKEAGQFQNQIDQLGGVTGDINKEAQAVKDTAGLASKFKSADDIQKLAADDSQVAAFQKGVAGTTGAGQFQAQGQGILNKSQSELGDVQRMAGLTGSEAGRFELLRQSLGRPSYSRGQQKLDQTLLQTGGNLGELQKQAAQQAQAGQTLYGTQSEGLTTALGGLTGAAADTSQQLKTALGGLADPAKEGSKATGAFGDLQSKLDRQHKEFIDKGNLLNESLAKGVPAIDMLPEEIKKQLGVTDSTNLYGLDLGEELKTVGSTWTPGAITKSQTASANDLATLKALEKLSGSKTPGFIDEAQVGTATQKFIDPNKAQGFKDRIAAKQESTFNQLLAPMESGYLKLLGDENLQGFDSSKLQGKSGTERSKMLYEDMKSRVPQLQQLMQIPGSLGDEPRAKAQSVLDFIKDYENIQSGKLTGSGINDIIKRITPQSAPVQAAPVAPLPIIPRFNLR